MAQEQYSLADVQEFQPSPEHTAAAPRFSLEDVAPAAPPPAPRFSLSDVAGAAPTPRPAPVQVHGFTTQSTVTEPPPQPPPAPQRPTDAFAKATSIGPQTPPRAEGSLEAPEQGYRSPADVARANAVLGTATGASGVARVLQAGKPVANEPFDAVKAGNDVIAGLLEASTPFIAGAAVVDPLPVAWGIVKATLVAKVGSEVARRMEARPETQELVGNVAGLLSGAIDANAFIERAKASGQAFVLSAKLSGSGYGPGDVPGYRTTGFSEGAPLRNPESITEMVRARPAPGEDVAGSFQSPPGTVRSDAAPVAANPEGLHEFVPVGEEPQAPPVTPAPAPEDAAYEAKRKSDAAARAPQTYEQFKTQYEEVFRRMMAYKPTEAGSQMYAEEMAKLADAHPEWADRAENDGVGVHAGEPVDVTPPKGERETHTFSSTQINLPPETAQAISAFAKSIPSSELADNGRENEPHVTVKYGLHTNDVEKVRKVLANEPPIVATLGKTSMFPNSESDNGDVLKVDVDSGDLHRLNAKIAEALETTDTHPEYKPHATIAYLKPGRGQQYVGDARLEGHTVTVDRVTFTAKDGRRYEIPLTGVAEASSGETHAVPVEIRDAVDVRQSPGHGEAVGDGNAEHQEPAGARVQEASPETQEAIAGATDAQLHGLIDAAGAHAGDLTPEHEAALHEASHELMRREEPVIQANVAQNGLEVKFPAKPSPETLAKLKTAGFRWAKGSKVWYKKRPMEAPTAPNKAPEYRAWSEMERQTRELLGVESNAVPSEAEPSNLNSSGLQVDKPSTTAAGERTIGEGHAAPNEPRAADQAALAGTPAEDVEGPGDGRETEFGGVRGAGADAGSDRGSGVERPAVSGGVRSPQPGVGVPAGGDGSGAAEARRPGDVDRPVVAVAGRANYRITDADHLGEGTDTEKIDANLAAIRLLKQLQAEERLATPAEQAVLVKYVGWGAFAQRIFKTNFGKVTDKRGQELQQLLTPEEYEAAAGSTLNAHYTSAGVIRAVYAALARLGFPGGRALEPAVGTGNFIGLMPPEMAARTSWSATELDTITAAIAQQLYQKANIEHTGLEKAKLATNFFDLAVSNVPFGDYPVFDPAFAKRPAVLSKMIHNYFFAKGLDLVRPGGIVAFITSHGTLDAKNPAVREYLARHAELLGAVRLPRDAFSENAGTKVITDLVILKKRERPLDGTPRDAWIGTDTLSLTTERGQETHQNLNAYFLAHPEMVVGTHAAVSTGGLYAANEYTVLAPEGEFTTALDAALAHLPAGVYEKRDTPKSTEPLTAKQAVPAPTDVKRDAFTVRDGQVWQRQGDELVHVDADLPAATKARIIGLVGVRGALFDTMRAMLEDKPEAAIKAAQKALGQRYDAFVKKFGYIHERGNIQAFDDDPDLPRLLALENYDAIEKKAAKADIFTKRTLAPPQPITHVDEPDRAMLVALNETGRLDWTRIEQLTGKSQPELLEALAGLVYQTPRGEWVTADAYLSGDVKTKLAEAEGAAKHDEAFRANVDALKKVIPEDIPPSKISVRLGSGWVPSQTIQQFIAHLLNTRGDAVMVTYVAPLAQWTLMMPHFVGNLVTNTEKWGTPRATALEIIDDTMNLRAVTVYDTIRNGDGTTSRVLNQDATQAAREKQQEIRDEFEKWLWSDAARRDKMLRLYNDTHNRTRRRSFDGSHLDLPGMAIFNPSKPRNEQLRPHQKDGIWRSLQSPNMLAAHVVGAGKTYLVVGSAMEKRRQGTARKPVVAVPNSLVMQWARAFAEMYPTSNVLSVRKKDFEPQNRKQFMAKIATGDWDAVIIPHSVFTRIPLREDTWTAFFKKQLAVLEDYIEELTATEGRRSRTVKQMEAMKRRLQVKLEKRAAKAKARTDDVVYWEELGVDALYVDEAHLFKNLWFPSKMTRISGLPNSESDRAFDMLLKVRHTQALNNGGGVFFATGTPVSNTMAEMYTMQRYLQPEVLEAHGLEHFDAWAQMFGDTRTTMEVSPEGSGFRMKTSFSRFTNMGRLSEMFRAFADVKTAKDLKLPVPALKHGMARAVTVPASPALQAYVKHLTQRAEAIRAGKVKDPREDNMLKITSEGRKGALDMRLLDVAYGDDPESKLNKAVGEIFTTWQDWKAQKGTQLVFSDLGTPKGKKTDKAGAVVDEDGETDESEADAVAQIRALNASAFDLYADVKAKLVKRGIPAEEIAFIHDANTDVRKQTLFDDVNAGKVRILMGSTEKMGAGMNVQRLLVRLHQLDAPWRPSDVEQRTGRILRQGNHLAATIKGFEVEITNYITKGSFDAYIWQTLERKAAMIEQGLSGLEDGEDVEDVGGGALNPAEMKAAASGNPMVLEKVKAEAELRQLLSLRRAATDKRYRLEGLAQRLPLAIGAARDRIREAHAFIAQTAKPEPFSLSLVDKVDGKKFTTYTDREAASIHLAKLAAEARAIALTNATEVSAPIGTYAGHDLYVQHGGVSFQDWEAGLRTSPEADYSVSVAGNSRKQPRSVNGWIPALDYALFKQPVSEIAHSEASITEGERRLADAREELNGVGRAHEARISELEAQIARIDKDLDLDAKSQAKDAEIADDEEAGGTVAPAPKKPSGGTTLQSTILPGAAEFGEYVLEPAAKAVAEQVQRHGDDVRALFAPSSVSAHSVRAAGVIRANAAARAQRTARAQRLLRSIEKMMDGWSHEQALAFWDVMEGQQPATTLDPQVQAVAALYRQILDEKRDTELLPRGLIRNYLENYWGHEWQPKAGPIEAALRRLFGRRPLQGPESFRKRRSIPTMREGIEEHHLEPLSWNPTTQLLRKLLEMDKSIAAFDIKQELKRRGEAKFVAVGKKPVDPTWQRFHESFGTVYGAPTVTTPSGDEMRLPYGRLVAGHYYGPPEVVRLLNNYLSPGLRGKSALFDLYRVAGNFLNQMQLGMSAFHAVMTGVESMVSKQSLAFELLSRGEVGEALRKQLEMPVAPIVDLVRGGKDLKAFYAHDANAQMIDDVIGEVVQAGGGFGWDFFEHTGAPAKFMAALRAKNPVGVGLRAVPALVELTAKPIMEFWVPRLKMAAFRDMARMELRTLGPSPDIDEVRRVLGAAWDSVDNRFGQLRYDNLFWHNALKDLGMASVRSLGWNLGSLREAGGALPAQLRQVGLLSGGGAAGSGGKGKRPLRLMNVGVKRGKPVYEATKEPWLHRKFAWVTATVMVYGLLGAIYQYLHTGKRPSSAKDYFFPHNGDGDTRVSIPGYVKDWYAFANDLPHSAVTTVSHKLNPLLSLLAELWENEDFFGTAIYDPEDPLLKELGDVLAYVAADYQPIAIQNFERRKTEEQQSKQAEGVNAAESFLGINKAPATVSRSPLENYLQSITPASVHSKLERAQGDERRDIRTAIRSGNAPGLRTAVTEGHLSAEQIAATVRSSQRSALQASFGRTTIQQALHAYEIASPEERGALIGLLLSKVRLVTQVSDPTEQRQLIARYRAAVKLPLRSGELKKAQ